MPLHNRKPSWHIKAFRVCCRYVSKLDQASLSSCRACLGNSQIVLMYSWGRIVAHQSSLGLNVSSGISILATTLRSRHRQKHVHTWADAPDKCVGRARHPDNPGDKCDWLSHCWTRSLSMPWKGKAPALMPHGRWVIARIEKAWRYVYPPKIGAEWLWKNVKLTESCWLLFQGLCFDWRGGMWLKWLTWLRQLPESLERSRRQYLTTAKHSPTKDSFLSLSSTRAATRVGELRIRLIRHDWLLSSCRWTTSPSLQTQLFLSLSSAFSANVMMGNPSLTIPSGERYLVRFFYIPLPSKKPEY